VAIEVEVKIVIGIPVEVIVVVWEKMIVLIEEVIVTEENNIEEEAEEVGIQIIMIVIVLIEVILEAIIIGEGIMIGLIIEVLMAIEEGGTTLTMIIDREREDMSQHHLLIIRQDIDHIIIKVIIIIDTITIQDIVEVIIIEMMID